MATDTASDITRRPALAVKHRPRRLADVVGQRGARRALAASVLSGEVPHQLLLSGSSGLGKTTVARIFAAALLCEDPPGDGDCCGRCASCCAIWDPRDTHPDVIEMDAASHGGKDEIAALGGRVGLAPIRGNWKVFIVDEAHGISRAGADAFLKLLEEPPDHVVFILATTEANKMLATIRGRCIEIGFAPPTRDELVEHVTAVAASEGWELPDGVAADIVDVTGDELGVRGVLSALDKLSGLLSTGDVTRDTVTDTLGAPPQRQIAELATAIGSGDLAGAFAATDALCGRYPAPAVRRGLLRELRSALRNANRHEAAAAARRVAAIAEVGDDRAWLDVGVARATHAALDGAAGLSELVARAERAATELHRHLTATPAPAPASTPREEAPASQPPSQPSAADAASPEPQQERRADTRAERADTATPASDDGDPGPSEPPPDSWDTDDDAPPPARTRTRDRRQRRGGNDRRGTGAAPAGDTVPRPSGETAADTTVVAAGDVDDPWFSDPGAETISPAGSGSERGQSGGPTTGTRPSTTKAPAKKAAAKKAPAKKAAKKAAPKRPARNAASPDNSGGGDAAGPQGARRRTGVPSGSRDTATVDLERLGGLVAARDELVAKILAQLTVRAEGGTVTVVVPAALVGAVRERPQVRSVVDAAATALGATAVNWKAQRST
jgi:DNA polymerase-3 subunit gamma/tau